MCPRVRRPIRGSLQDVSRNGCGCVLYSGGLVYWL